MKHRFLLLGLLGAALLLAGCADAGSGPGGGGASPTATSAPVVSLVRTGGFAGVTDQVTVAADGTWSATDRTGGRRTGRLSEQQRAELDRLAGDPALAREAGRVPSPSNCADTYSYQLTVGGVRVDFVDCPTDTDPPPTAAAIVGLVTRAVWGG